MTPILLLLLLAAAPPALDRNDVPFASPAGKSLLLDLHVPAGRGPFPAVIVVHGGGFDMGDKRSFVTPLFEPLTAAGFAWFTINYRLAPEAKFPEPVQDLESAIRWVKANAAVYRVDPARIALVGESAGGYLVSYVGTHPTPETRVAAVVPFYAPNDPAGMMEQIRLHPEQFDSAKSRQHANRGGGMRFFDGGPERLREMSPLAAVRPGLPPFLCIHGDADEQVPYSQSVLMRDALQAAGVPCRLITVEGGRHGMMNWEKSPAMLYWKRELIDWLKATLK